MDYRQIHTWVYLPLRILLDLILTRDMQQFQNRRARARREGEPLKLKITDRPSYTTSDDLGDETMERRSPSQYGMLSDDHGPLSSTSEEVLLRFYPVLDCSYSNEANRSLILSQKSHITVR
jgi:hypothetical protein